MSHGKWQIWFKSLKVWLQGKETAVSLFMNMGLQKKNNNEAALIYNVALSLTATGIFFLFYFH